ncbi:1-phosphofructokinase [Listeria aquatica]|uniref:Tagatose-6-phosphate kinase n=1 Tax=Listeria aquatica FSL S10-1188 TaxID=1265818 RepID=W7B2K7_9LIST|nr:1-phosphofructokinase [Listeria aquatica]EUJ21454.1 1-phosphofructokinase [Listeria aquatica FSL S10-1188]
MIYTVTLNPSIDYIVEVENFSIGALNRMKEDHKLPGGKGINVSRVLGQLQIESKASGFLGGFTGGFIADWLKKEGVKTNFAPVLDDTRINIKLKSGEETEINGLGPVVTESEQKHFFETLAGIGAGDIVILSGSVPPSLGKNFYDKIIEFTQAKKADFMIDTTGEELLAALPKKPILIKPNHHELADLFHVNFETKEDLIPYGKKCLEMGAKHVIVSMAGDGALLFSGDEVYFAKPIKGKVKNSVGAGDSMIAGFVGKFHQSGDAVEAFRLGVATGTATAFSTDLAEAKRIEEILPQVEIVKMEDSK